MKNNHLILSLLLLLFTSLAQAQGIHRTACNGDVQRLDSLLATTSIDTLNNTGTTPLMAAAFCRQAEAFNFLMNKGADVHAVNNFGNSALIYATQIRNVDMVKRLLEKGAEVNIVNEIGQTPLHRAVQSDNKEIFDLLLEARADVNLGNTSLHRAVLNDNADFVRRLINSETYVDSVNSYGNTPLAIALRQGSTEIVEILMANGADMKKVTTQKLKGDFVGQKRPGLEAKMFAPNFISTENFNHTPTFSPDEKEIYYTLESRQYNGGTIMVSRLVNGVWTEPEAADVEGDFREIDPFISPDGSTMFYSSDRPINEGDSASRNIDMWMVKKEGRGWGKPIHLGAAVSSEHAEWFPTVSEKGNLFYSTGPGRSSNIVYSEFRNGQYQEPVSLGDSVNSRQRDYDPVIAPDESYVIWSSNRPGGAGSVDIYVSFKKADGTWTKAKNLGDRVNTSTIEFAPRLSNDGKYLFFNREGDIWWIDAQVIWDLK